MFGRECVRIACVHASVRGHGVRVRVRGVRVHRSGSVGVVGGVARAGGKKVATDVVVDHRRRPGLPAVSFCSRSPRKLFRFPADEHLRW